MECMCNFVGRIYGNTLGGLALLKVAFDDCFVVCATFNVIAEIARGVECAEPKLYKFMGRPKDLSPKARVNALMGYKKPFDRHDWVVDRCGLAQVRSIPILLAGGSVLMSVCRCGTSWTSTTAGP